MIVDDEYPVLGTVPLQPKPSFSLLSTIIADSDLFFDLYHLLCLLFPLIGSFFYFIRTLFSTPIKSEISSKHLWQTKKLLR